jgi:hypothetical protein
MLAAVTFAAPVVAWPLILAAGVSAARISFTAWALRPVLAS